MKNIEILVKQLATAAHSRKVLEAEERAIKDQLLAAMRKGKVEKFQSESFGSVSVGHRSSYLYTDAVRELEERVKLKKVEEEKGLATEKVIEYILYKEPTV